MIKSSHHLRLDLARLHNYRHYQERWRSTCTLLESWGPLTPVEIY